MVDTIIVTGKEVMGLIESYDMKFCCQRDMSQEITNGDYCLEFVEAKKRLGNYLKRHGIVARAGMPLEQLLDEYSTVISHGWVLGFGAHLYTIKLQFPTAAVKPQHMKMSSSSIFN